MRFYDVQGLCSRLRARDCSVGSRSVCCGEMIDDGDRSSAAVILLEISGMDPTDRLSLPGGIEHYPACILA
jgi:hypothetical protein